MKRRGLFSYRFEIQEFPEDQEFQEDQPSTSRQGDSSQQKEMEKEEEEDWEDDERKPFSFWSPILREKIKRAKEAGVSPSYLPFTPQNRGRNRRTKRRINKILQQRRLEEIKKNRFSREMPENLTKHSGGTK